MESERPRKEFTAHGRGQNKDSDKAVFLHAKKRSPFLHVVGMGPGALAALPGGAFEIRVASGNVLSWSSVFPPA